MFSKLSLLAVVAPLVAGLTLQAPSNPVSGGTVTIRWTSASGDPDTWSLELVNEAFHNSFAIANNVIPDNNEITLELPVVPIGDGYTLEAVEIGNINNVFATSAPFSVGVNPSASPIPSTSGASSTTSVGSAGSTTRSITTTVATTSTGVVTTTRPATSNTSFGSTVTSGGSSGTSGASSASSAGASTTSTTPNSAVPALKMNTNVGAFAAVLFSAIAGAAIIVL